MRTAFELKGKRVLVVGIGNSAMDIATESSFVARKTILSSRRGAYILPKYLFGRPLDQIGAYMTSKLRLHFLYREYRRAVSLPRKTRPTGWNS